MRKRIKNRLVKLIGCEADQIFLADWDTKRIAWEETPLSDWYHTDFAKFAEIIDKAAEGTGYYIETLNSCEGSICKN